MNRLWVIALLALAACKDKPKAEPPAPAPVAAAAKKAEAAAPAPRPLVKEPLGPAAGLNVDPATSASVPALAATPDGPIAAWRERNTLLVRRWSGTAWEPLGGPPDADRKRAVESPALSISPEGTPWLAWKEMDKNDVARLHVARLDGAAWKELPEPGSKGAVRHFVLNAASTPKVVGWTEPDGEPYHLQLRELKDDQWVAPKKGPGTASATVLQPPALAQLAANGAPVVVWLEREAGKVAVRALKWEAAGSNDLPALAEDAADGDSVVSAAATADGTVLIALSWNAGLRSVRSLKMAAAAWESTPLPAARNGALPRLAAGGSIAAYAFAQDALQVARWDGTAWTVIDPKLHPRTGNPATVAVAPDGTIYAAYLDSGPEGGGPAQLHVVRYR